MSEPEYDWKYWTIRDKVNDLTRRLMIQGERLKIEALKKKKRKEITMSKPKYTMTIRWGAEDFDEDAPWLDSEEDKLESLLERSKTYSFNTLGELQAFGKGVEEGEGWLDYEILKTEPVRWLDGCND